jgi:hypothetical protein
VPLLAATYNGVQPFSSTPSMHGGRICCIVRIILTGAPKLQARCNAFLPPTSTSPSGSCCDCPNNKADMHHRFNSFVHNPGSINVAIVYSLQQNQYKEVNFSFFFRAYAAVTKQDFMSNPIINATNK